jgi:predicted metal-dependent phosphoesterase TrpH
MHHYIGSLHEHSGYSDGYPSSQPRDYYASAKGYGLDFLGSGEHSDSADLPMVVSEECLTPAIADCAIADEDNPTDSFRKWDATREQARAATTEDFTGFRGFEWTSDRFGHINVYFSRNDANAKADGGYGVMDTFYNWLTRDPLLEGGADGLATFNHPGDKKLSADDPGFNWNDFAYVPAADTHMAGIEVFNGNKDFGQYFAHALDKGWHLGAIGAEDKGHDPSDGDQQGDDDWGGPKWAKTVFIATDKTEAGLREAMTARRFYAVQDNTIRMDLEADSRPMGSRITRELGETVGIEFNVWQEPFGTAVSQGLATVELVSNGGVVVDDSQISEGDEPDLTFDAPVTNTETYYFARVLGTDGKPLAYSSPVWISSETAKGGEWLAGDLHIHTTYSHDSYGGPTDDNTQDPQDYYTVGHPVTSQFAVAASRGLDYLAITDHNDIRSQTDPGWQWAKDHGIVPIAGYENSLRGHGQMLGAESCYDSAGSYSGTDCANHGDTSAAGINATAAALRAEGGLFQINHPFDDTNDEVASSWKYGYDVVPDTLEVWNITRVYQPPFPAATNNDAGVHFWERFLDMGYHVGATGGSDNHYIATTPVQGAGQPTTWVFAKDRSQDAVLEGLKAGRTFVSTQPPNLGGPQLFLEADADGDGVYESIVGDTVPAGSAFRARVVGAPGSVLQAFTNGGQQAGLDAPVATPDYTVPVTPGADSTWVRVEIGLPDAQAQRKQACDAALGTQTTYCRNKITALAMTSAIYISQPMPGIPGATNLI